MNHKTRKAIDDFIKTMTNIHERVINNHIEDGKAIQELTPPPPLKDRTEEFNKMSIFNPNKSEGA